MGGNTSLEDISVVKSVIEALNMEMTAKLLDEELAELEDVLSSRVPKKRTYGPHGADGMPEYKTLYDKILAVEAMQAFEASNDSVVKSQKWQAQLTSAEKIKLCLARALIMNPEVMVLHRPLASFNVKKAAQILHVLKMSLDNAGIGLPENTLIYRRPRTYFFTPDTKAQSQQADITWQMDNANIFEVEKHQVTDDFSVSSQSMRAMTGMWNLNVEASREQAIEKRRRFMGTPMPQNKIEPQPFVDEHKEPDPEYYLEPLFLPMVVDGVQVVQHVGGNRWQVGSRSLVTGIDTGDGWLQVIPELDNSQANERNESSGRFSFWNYSKGGGDNVVDDTQQQDHVVDDTQQQAFLWRHWHKA